jgi:hypothetical protein
MSWAFDRYGDDYAEAVRNGIRVVKMDLIPILMAMVRGHGSGCR